MIKSIRNEKEKKTCVISVAGFCDCTIPYYIAKTLAGMGCETLAIDNSKYTDMFYALSGGVETEVAEADLVIGLKNIEFSPEPFSRFDYVVVWHGCSIDKELWEYSDLRILSPDYNEAHNVYLAKELEDVSHDMHIVFWNKVSSRVAEKDVLKRLGVKDNDVYVEIGQQVIEADGTDMGNAVNLSKNGTQALKHFSVQFKEVIAEAVRYFYKNEAKTIKVCIAKAR